MNIAEYFQNKEAEIIEKIRQIVEIESPSYDEAGSREVVDWIENEARNINSISSIDRIYREGYGEHLLIRVFSEIPNPQSPIFILGHTDTVHPRGANQKNPTRIEGDKFYGCGIFDMKANVILMLEILRAFDELGLKPSRPIIILLSCDEEVGSDTGRELVEAEAKKSAYCLVCEPSANGKVKTGRKGTGWYELRTHGIPAHAGLEPEKGASAILEISRQIQQIHMLNDLEKGTTINVCTINGGTTSNVIPENAAAEIDVRFTSMEEANRIQNEIRNLNSFDERVSLELLGEINRPPMERTEDVIRLFEKAKSIADSMDYEFGETQVGGASDGNFVGALGIPVLDGLGITGNGAHTNNEYIL
ncbi:MAG TPA: M20 family metallopeptidase, partial [Pyrinomonadaceae bacterium]|nr:M20 family metallopeptidase [Pyrinomonadaceae bacterium]